LSKSQFDHQIEYNLLTNFLIKPVPIPTFAEARHESILALQEASDTELMQSHRQEPEQAKFFIALFCRYAAIVYSIIQHVSSDSVQVDYAFALAWQRIFDQIQLLEDHQIKSNNWQQWIVTVAGKLIGQETLPAATDISYRLREVSPPLRCYTLRSLELVQPLLRLVFIMGEQWQWSPKQIVVALRAEGEDLAEMDVPLYLAEAQKAFEKTLPLDLLEIYRQI
jgi:hypothetical protein